MRHGHVSIEEVSAYVDGEARRPGAVARHIKACPECGRRYAELSRLAAQMRSLAAPDVSPAFATRVLACAVEARPAPRSAWRWAMPLGAAALVCLVAGVAWRFSEGEDGGAPYTLAGDESTPLPELERLIEVRLAANPGALPDEPAPWTNEDEELPTSALLSDLATTEWFDSLAAQVGDEQDMDELLAGLSPAETEVLKQMLSEYANEG